MGKDIKEKVLGTAKMPKATDDHLFDESIAFGTLLLQGTVTRACCMGCGYCLELLEAGAERLAKLANTPKPPSWQGFCFKTQRCWLCDKDYKDVELVSQESQR